MVEDDSYHYEPRAITTTLEEADEERAKARKEKLIKELEDKKDGLHDDPIFKVVVIAVTALWCGWMLAGFIRYVHKRLCQTHTPLPGSPKHSPRNDTEMFAVSGSSGRYDGSTDRHRPPSPRDDWQSERRAWRSRQDPQSSERLMNSRGSSSSRSSRWSALSPVGFVSRLENEFSL